MKRGIGGELLVFMRMRMKKRAILDKGRVKGCRNLWDREMKILGILLGNWKLESVGTFHVEVEERVADGQRNCRKPWAMGRKDMAHSNIINYRL